MFFFLCFFVSLFLSFLLVCLFACLLCYSLFPPCGLIQDLIVFILLARDMSEAGCFVSPSG